MKSDSAHWCCSPADRIRPFALLMRSTATRASRPLASTMASGTASSCECRQRVRREIARAFPAWARAARARPCARHRRASAPSAIPRSPPMPRSRCWPLACPAPSCPGGISCSSPMPPRSAIGAGCIRSSAACARRIIPAIPIAATRRCARWSRRSGSAPKSPSPSTRR